MRRGTQTYIEAVDASFALKTAINASKDAHSPPAA